MVTVPLLVTVVLYVMYYILVLVIRPVNFFHIRSQAKRCLGGLRCLSALQKITFGLYWCHSTYITQLADTITSRAIELQEDYQFKDLVEEFQLSGELLVA